jgi:hypothetical protein
VRRSGICRVVEPLQQVERLTEPADVHFDEGGLSR